MKKRDAAAKGRQTSGNGNGRPHLLYSGILDLVEASMVERRRLGSGRLHALADKTRKWGNDFHETPVLQFYADSAADGLEELAEYVASTSMIEIAEDGIEAARRHPAAVIGLAASTMLAAAWATRAGLLARKPRTKGERHSQRLRTRKQGKSEAVRTHV